MLAHFTVPWFLTDYHHYSNNYYCHYIFHWHKQLNAHSAHMHTCSKRKVFVLNAKWTTQTCLPTIASHLRSNSTLLVPLFLNTFRLRVVCLFATSFLIYCIFRVKPKTHNDKQKTSSKTMHRFQEISSRRKRSPSKQRFNLSDKCGKSWCFVNQSWCCCCKVKWAGKNALYFHARISLLKHKNSLIVT